MKKLTKEWVDKAEDDFAEKYMKAILQESGTEFEKIHDLDVLLEKCKRLIPDLEKYRKGLIELSSFAVEIRYPGIKAMKEEAENCISVVRVVRKTIRKYLL